MNKLLQVKDLKITLKHEKRMLVKKVSFSIAEGSSLTVLGQSGCGKTMTCHCIMGLLDARKFRVEGEIICCGMNLLAASPRECRKLYGREIAFIPQNPMTALDPSMKIGRQMAETLRLHAQYPKNMRKGIVLDALKKAGLKNAERVFLSYPHELSGGMLQRVLIAMVLMVNARLVIADEPTTALDVVHRNETIEVFRRLRDNGVAVLMVTHDFAAAIQLDGDMLIMNRGEIVEMGNAAEMLQSPKCDYTRQLISASMLSGDYAEVRA